MKTSLKIAIIGATGNVGKRITEEALNRGHHVTGIARTVDGLASSNNLTLKAGDIGNPEALAGMLKGHDLVISSVKSDDFDSDKLIKAVRLSGVNVDAWKIAIYGLGGAICGIAGILIASRLNSAQPALGQGYELERLRRSSLAALPLAAGLERFSALSSAPSS